MRAVGKGHMQGKTEEGNINLARELSKGVGLMTMTLQMLSGCSNPGYTCQESGPLGAEVGECLLQF